LWRERIAILTQANDRAARCTFSGSIRGGILEFLKADTVNPFEPLKNPTQSWPLGRLLELMWYRRLWARQLVA
jgi:hypothetical protein